MGLDIEIRQVRKPTVEDVKVYDADEFCGVMASDEWCNSPLGCQVAPYTVQAKVRFAYDNCEAIKAVRVFYYDEIRSWRKAADISRWFHDSLDCAVENTGMYLLTSEVIAAFNLAFPQFAITDEEIKPERPLFYWEWY